jgi:hypothetical protein
MDFRKTTAALWAVWATPDFTASQPRALSKGGGRCGQRRFHASQPRVNNWRHHRCDRDHSRRTDPYSSAHAIAEWNLERHPDQLPVVRPTTWLLTHGYRLAKAIRTDENPGPDPTP